MTLGAFFNEFVAYLRSLYTQSNRAPLKVALSHPV